VRFNVKSAARPCPARKLPSARLLSAEINAGTQRVCDDGKFDQTTTSIRCVQGSRKRGPCSRPEGWMLDMQLPRHPLELLQ
jgi:hypothetical protein